MFRQSYHQPIDALFRHRSELSSPHMTNRQRDRWLAVKDLPRRRERLVNDDCLKGTSGPLSSPRPAVYKNLTLVSLANNLVQRGADPGDGLIAGLDGCL